MYSIVLTDGKIVDIDADEVMCREKTRIISFYNDRKLVSEINMDNIAGWIDAGYKESEEVWVD